MRGAITACNYPEVSEVAVLRIRHWKLIALVCSVAGGLEGQTASSAATGAAQTVSVRQFETRAQLEALARTAESQRRTSEAWLLRARLQNGDFQEGDRIVIVLDGSTIVSDTLQVRAGKVLQFPRMGEVALVGVLRSELTDTLRRHLSKYLTSPVLRASPLLPLAVIGNVVAPGYHYVAADVVLRDVIMKAGGPTGTADLNKVVVRRGGDVIWDAKSVQVALTDGLSVDALHLRAGDELFVPERRQFRLSNVMTVVSSAIALTLAVVQITSR